MGKLIDRTGVRFGRLIVLVRDEAEGPASKGRRTKWKCQCDCGALIVATGHELASGDTKSCGCLRNEKIARVNRRHSLSKTPTYRSWQAAKDRCSNPNNEKFASYGARGIRMCDDWESSFDKFLMDMGTRPAGTTLDRLYVDGNYEPSNCRWATPSQQAANTRRTIVWNGQKTTIKAVAAKHGVPRTSLNKLLKRGMRPEQALAHALERRK